MPDYPTDEPATYEKQAGNVRPALFKDAMQVQYSEHPATWSPPNAEQLAKLEAWAEETPGVPDLESAHVAVIDGYQDPTPGYAGPLAVLVFMHSHTEQTRSEGVTTVALSNLSDPRDDIEADTEAAKVLRGEKPEGGA